MNADDLMKRLEKWGSPDGDTFSSVCARAVTHMLQNEDCRTAIRMCYQTGPKGLVFALRPGIDLLVEYIETRISKPSMKN